jgi:hypothetical protein
MHECSLGAFTCWGAGPSAAGSRARGGRMLASDATDRCFAQPNNIHNTSFIIRYYYLHTVLQPFPAGPAELAASMAAQGAQLQNSNVELVKCELGSRALLGRGPGQTGVQLAVAASCLSQTV